MATEVIRGTKHNRRPSVVRSKEQFKQRGPEEGASFEFLISQAFGAKRTSQGGLEAGFRRRRRLGED